jgi:hypothetical protein
VIVCGWLMSLFHASQAGLTGGLNDGLVVFEDPVREVVIPEAIFIDLPSPSPLFRLML